MAAPGHGAGAAGGHPRHRHPGGALDLQAAAAPVGRGRHRAPHRRPQPARAVGQQRRDRPPRRRLQRDAGPARPRARDAEGAGRQRACRRGAAFSRGKHAHRAGGHQHPRPRRAARQPAGRCLAGRPPARPLESRAGARRAGALLPAAERPRRRQRVRGALARWHRAGLGGAFGAATQLPGPGRVAHRLRPHQPPQADGAAAGVVGQGLRGQQRRHPHRGRRPAHPQRQPGFLAPFRPRTAGNGGREARAAAGRQQQHAARCLVAHRDAARHLAGRTQPAPAQRQRVPGLGDGECGAPGQRLGAGWGRRAGRPRRWRGLALHLHQHRHQRPQAQRAAHPLPGRARRAHRAAQPQPVHRAPAPGRAAGPAPRAQGGGDVHRPRPLQGHQRQPGPPHRRRPAAQRGRAAAGRRARRRHRQPPGWRRVRGGAGRSGKRGRGGPHRARAPDPARARAAPRGGGPNCTSRAAWASPSSPTTPPTSTC